MSLRNVLVIMSDDLAADPRQAPVLRAMQAELRSTCDPEAVDALAKSDQQAMIERYGDVEAAIDATEGTLRTNAIIAAALHPGTCPSAGRAASRGV